MDESEITSRLLKMFKERDERVKKLRQVAKILDIPIASPDTAGPLVSMKDLWDILSDENKLQELVSKIKMKSFW